MMMKMIVLCSDDPVPTYVGAHADFGDVWWGKGKRK